MNQTKNNYLRLVLSQVPAEYEDLLSAICFEYGASGISQILKFSQKSLQYEASIEDEEILSFDVFFESPVSEDFFAYLQANMPMLQYHLHSEDYKDWMHEWKKHFKAFALIGDLWVVPSWLEIPKEAKQVIRMDPGMAFGTGTHATTGLAASLISKLYAQQNYNTAIDVGTGTGILAIQCELLGATDVVAIEIDTEARRVARENLEINSSKYVKVPDLLAHEVTQEFDLVIANIIDGVLVQLKNDLLKLRKGKAPMVLTGILAEREDYFLTNFLENTDLKVIARESRDEWLGFILQ